jgi:hypothetical protein
MLKDTINQILHGYFSGGAEKARAAELYQDNFDLDSIQSQAVCSGLLVPNRWFEFNQDELGILEELFSPKRVKELTSGAEPTNREQKRYRAYKMSQIKDGDIDADYITGFWIHRIVDSNGDDLFALTTAKGYSFNGIESEFHGLFLWEKDCIEYLSACGQISGIQHFQPAAREQSKDQFSFKFPRQRKRAPSQ